MQIVEQRGWKYKYRKEVETGDKKQKIQNRLGLADKDCQEIIGKMKCTKSNFY